MKVIINADDFGLTEGVNKGIIEAHKNGIVTRTTLMMNGLAVQNAINLAKDHPNLLIGIHLVLSFGKPLSLDGIEQLIDNDGYFKYKSIPQSLSNEEILQIEHEWRKQIETFLSYGIELDHIDSHHHVHGWPELKSIVLKLGKEYNVPIRYTDSLKEASEHLLTDYLWDEFYQDGVDHLLFNKLKDLPYSSIEVMVHPAYIDEDLIAISSYTDDREKERKILSEIDVPEWVNLC